MRRALPIAACVGLAGVATASGHPWVAIGLLVAGMLAVQPALLRRPAPPRADPPVRRRIRRVARRGVDGVVRTVGVAARAMGAVVATAAALVVFYLVVTPMGLVARLLGVRLLPRGTWHRRAAPTGARTGRAVIAAPRGAAGTEALGPRLTWGAAVALVALGAFVATLLPRALERAPDESAVPEQLRGATYDPFTSAALSDADWLAEAGAEFGAVGGGLTYTSFVGNSLRDHQGRYVNVVDRRRRSYEPADTTGEPIDVWFLGGSTMFGFSAQRDLHTIPSEVVRLAEADGVLVRAHNLGAPGYVNMQETILAAQLLAAGERPDLIVFYDGINDFGLAFQQAFGGIGVVGDPSDLSAFAYRRLLAGQLTGSADPPVPLVTAPDVGNPPRAAAVIEALLGVYERGIELAGALGDRYGVPVAHFWQPDLFNTTALEPGERQVVEDLGLDDFRYDAIARISRSTVHSLPDGVLDLSQAFVGETGPVLTDQAHTNELGARLVAEAMYPHLGPALAALAEGTNGRLVSIAP